MAANKVQYKYRWQKKKGQAQAMLPSNAVKLHLVLVAHHTTDLFYLEMSARSMVKNTGGFPRCNTYANVDEGRLSHAPSFDCIGDMALHTMYRAHHF